MAAPTEAPAPMPGMTGFPMQVKPEPHDWSAYNQANSGNVYANLNVSQPPPPPQQNGMATPINIMPSDEPAPEVPPQAPPPATSQAKTTPKKKPRGRPKKIKEEPKDGTANANQPKDGDVLPGGVKIKQEKITDNMPVKKKRDRFKGTTEEEVLKKTLPDLICPNLDILIIGINPGLTAAYMGHHYAGPGNHFWKCMYLSGIIPEQLNGRLDYKMLEYGVGSTNIVERTTRGSNDLSRKEIKEGGEILKEKVLKFKPKIAVFNGKGIYEVFCGKKNFWFGKQPEPFPDCPETQVYVMPSSSARCAQLPRAVDKVPFYEALRRFRDYLRGKIPQLDDSEVCFPDLELKVKPKVELDADGNPIKTEPEEPKLDKDGKPVVKKEPKTPTKKTPTKKTPPAKRAPRKRKSTGKTPEHATPAANSENGQAQAQQPQAPAQQIVIAPDNVMPSGHPMVKQEPGTDPSSQGNSYPGYLPQSTSSAQPSTTSSHPGLPPQSTANSTSQPPSTSSSGLDELFSGGGSNLVKQEDLSELAQFGIGPGSFLGPQFGAPPAHGASLAHGVLPVAHGAPPPAHTSPSGGPPFHRPGFPSSVHVQDPFQDGGQPRQFMNPNVTSPSNTQASMHPYWSVGHQYPGQSQTFASPMPAHQHQPPNFSSPPFTSPGDSPFSSSPGQPNFSSPPQQGTSSPQTSQNTPTSSTPTTTK